MLNHFINGFPRTVNLNFFVFYNWLCNRDCPPIEFPYFHSFQVNLSPSRNIFIDSANFHLERDPCVGMWCALNVKRRENFGGTAILVVFLYFGRLRCFVRVPIAFYACAEIFICRKNLVVPFVLKLLGALLRWVLDEFEYNVKSWQVSVILLYVADQRLVGNRFRASFVVFTIFKICLNLGTTCR